MTTTERETFTSKVRLAETAPAWVNSCFIAFPRRFVWDKAEEDGGV